MISPTRLSFRIAAAALMLAAGAFAAAGFYLPESVIINNIEFDHADIFENLEAIKKSFRLLVRLVPDRDFDPSVHARIEHGLRVLIGEHVRIAFEHVDAIALTPSGKRRVTVCELNA